MPLNVLLIGAHPDDCDLKAGGLAIMYARAGHRVKCVSVTNGDAGHPTAHGRGLAERRRAEAAEAGRRGGFQYEVLDHRDGFLTPSLDVRWELLRLLRAWRADVVITHRTMDYHPDHRATATAVIDAAALVGVPAIESDLPATGKPLLLYFADEFSALAPFRADLVVPIESVMDAKLDVLDAHASQMYEWLPWAMNIRNVPGERDQRLALLRSFLAVEEKFEISEYGSKPTPDELRTLMPFASLGEARPL